MKRFTDKINESVDVNKLPTTEEFFRKYSDNTSLSEGHYDYLVDKDSFKEAMIEFTKLHVEAALRAALDNSETYMDGSSVFNEFENSILNAYPLTNIK